MSEAEFSSAEQPLYAAVPRHVLSTIWTRIAERLRAGEVLITPEDFQAALAKEYSVLTGGELEGETKVHIRQMIEMVNVRHPETYVTQGVQNGVNKAFGEGIRALKWTEAHVQARGAKSLRTFGRRECIRDLLQDANVRMDQLDLVQIVRDSIEDLRDGDLGPSSVVEVVETFDQNFSGPAVQPATTPVQPEATPVAVTPDMQEAIAAGDVEADEVQQRSEQAESRAGELHQQEMEKVPQRLDSLVQQGKITAEEADQYRQLSKVKDQLAKGEIAAAEGARIRNSLMDGEARDAIEGKVREEVEQASRYLHVFDSLRNIDVGRDEALAFLIRHKHTVVAETFQQEEIAAVHRELIDDAVLLNGVIDIMERKDHEIRMISVRLPPYNYVLNRGVEKIGNMTIEESFLDELRHLDIDDISERLSSAVPETRVRPAADLRCIISLIDHVIKRTPFRKEIRLLRIGQTIREFFNSTSDLAEARHQAENFVNLRMQRLFPDLSLEETAEIRQRSTEMIDEIEQQVIDIRLAEVEEERKQTEGVQQQQQSTGSADDGMELSDEEKIIGVQMGRVEIRVAGNLRKIPRKLMPDPDDPSKFVIAVRDPETGGTVPEERRGTKRYVERGRDGVWRAV